MKFLDPKLEEYVIKHTENEPELLAKLNRETHLKILMPRMLAGHLQGRAISMLSHMIQPKTILEIGTYTGYSAICWAEGMQEDGMIHTIDINEELETFAKGFIAEAGLTEKVTQHIGNAMDIIPTIEEELDVVFIDADKENYSNYFDLTIDRVRKGGYIIADNVLWSGKILDDPMTMDLDTESLNNFNKKVHADSRVQNVLFPIRDGIMICRKC